MGSNAYGTLRALRDERRRDLEAGAPAPEVLQGYARPVALAGWPREDFLWRSVMACVRVAIATVINAAEELGWRDFLNLLEDRQTVGMAKDVADLREEFHISGSTPLDINNLGTAHAKGCGFERHQLAEFSPGHVEGFADWCPMVEQMREMGFGQRIDQLYLWCNAFDSLYMHTAAPDVWYVHSSCLGRGDKYCRLTSDRFPEDDAGQDFYGKLTRYSDQKRAELAQTRPEPPAIAGFSGPQFLDGWSREQLLANGVKVKFGIAVDTLLSAAGAMGWEKLIDLVDSEQTWGLSQAALVAKKDFGISGHTRREAAALAMVGYQMLGFWNHQLIRFSEDGTEGVADWCPIVARAQRAELTEKLDEMSLWCDFYHNHQVHAVNEGCQLTHTHCLGRGDAYCRFVID
jgi:hypothetical protein